MGILFQGFFMKKKMLSAGAIPLRKKNGTWEFLLLRAFKYWDFPKGMVEEDEDPWDAALREVEEETGLSKFSTPFHQLYIETEPYGKGKVARYYVVVVEEDKEILFAPNPITGIVEHHEHKWVSYEEAYDLLVPRVQLALNWVQALIEAS
jgi:8-oxo-dGTP pyrophosphatase MutT (NUDIX family)